MLNKIGKCFAIAVAISVLLIFSSCFNGNGTTQNTAEVDFSVASKVQIHYNEQVIDCVIKFDGTHLDFNYSNEKDAIGGAYVRISESGYKITYTDMVFEGETANLPTSFLPNIIFQLLKSRGSSFLLESFDEENNCNCGSFSVYEYFLNIELYKTNGLTTYAIYIK